MPHNGSRISGEPLLKSFGEGTQVVASRHELPYPEREARRIEGGRVRDGLVQGSSVCIRLLCGGRRWLEVRFETLVWPRAIDLKSEVLAIRRFVEEAKGTGSRVRDHDGATREARSGVFGTNGRHVKNLLRLVRNTRDLERVRYGVSGFAQAAWPGGLQPSGESVLHLPDDIVCRRPIWS